MIAIDKTLISVDLLERKFVCDLQACKGACCVEGDAGAPLEEKEVSILEELIDKIKPYLRKEGIEAIEEQGVFTIDTDGEMVTPLVKGTAECAYTVFDDQGIAKCGIEIAYRNGKTDFVKPLSCQLYPVRIKSYNEYDAVNYHQWQICAPACKCGNEMNVKVYKFLKAPLIRKYGESWFEQLEEADKVMGS